MQAPELYSFLACSLRAFELHPLQPRASTPIRALRHKPGKFMLSRADFREITISPRPLSVCGLRLTIQPPPCVLSANFGLASTCETTVDLHPDFSGFCSLAGPTPAQTSAKQTDDDFASKSIEELMNVPVSSVSRKDQKLSKTPAAVYVITEEAIQRSGATIIPDLLRSVPGVQVAEVESNRWAISVRGFNGVYSNKLLVLVDGRTVYTPTTSGVYWDQLLAIPLDTIERIEVVRGPGGAVWGN